LKEFAFREIRGAKPPAAADMEVYGNVLLAIAGADGEISAREWEFLEGLGRSLGAPDQQIDKWRKFDYKGANLDSLLQHAHVKPRGRALLYDAIRVSRADGTYAKEEKAAAARVAKLLGVDAAVLTAIEALVEMETSVRNMRSTLLYS
jgi:tellurite resistance protein